MMHNPLRTLPELFAQLGLEASPDEFVRRHAPLPADVALEAAPFWNDAQKAFLATELARDADWAILIDRLDARLRDAPELRTR
ncbi:MAG: hypothetical protein RL654_277 [Pseudomonadota bacterium]|jgi:hypothetical protein